MNIKKIMLNKHFIVTVNIVMIIIIFFFVNKTVSGYKTTANISSLNAMPVLSIEVSAEPKEIEFIDYGWATHRFDIVNGKMGKDGLFHVNEVNMEYYIEIRQDSGELPLHFQKLYLLNEDLSLNTTDIHYVSGKGYGPFDLPYKKDDEQILNPDGYYESKYISRTRFMLVYTYGDCEIGDSSCSSKIDANEAGEEYNFHIVVNAYQKAN